MNSTVISITMYLFAANLVAGAIYVFGQKKVGLLRSEYFFIYLPWLALMVLMPSFEVLPGVDDTELSLRYFLFLVQGFSCGIFGGMVLLPRFWIRAETTFEKLRVTAISSLLVSALYMFTRWLLLLAFQFLLK